MARSSSQPPPTRTARRTGGREALRARARSLNTWIIVVNVLVFALNNILFAGSLLKTPWGVQRYQGVSREELGTGVIRRDIERPVEQLPNVFYSPILSPNPLTDDRGNVLVDLRNGQPIAREIGRERFTFRPVIDSLGHFSSGKLIAEWQIWRLITFQFLHVDIVHLLFNMLGLWFVGGIVEAYLGPRRYGAFYLACGACGAILYLLLNLVGSLIAASAPVLAPYAFGVLFSDMFTPLVGASAGVFGVLLGAAFIAPDDIVDVMLVIAMRLRTAVYLFLGLAVLNLLMGGRNAGGDAAHIGGALAGAYLIRHTHHLRDFLSVFRLDGPAPRPHGNGTPRTGVRRPALTGREQDELDRIVAKAQQRGSSSLTPDERAALRRINARLEGA